MAMASLVLNPHKDARWGLNFTYTGIWKGGQENRGVALWEICLLVLHCLVSPGRGRSFWNLPLYATCILLRVYISLGAARWGGEMEWWLEGGRSRTLPPLLPCCVYLALLSLQRFTAWPKHKVTGAPDKCLFLRPPSLSPSSTVVECGCGQGTLAAWIHLLVGGLEDSADMLCQPPALLFCFDAGSPLPFLWTKLTSQG